MNRPEPARYCALEGLRGQRTIFLVSVVPSPLTTFGTVAAAEERVEFRRFFLASLAGFLVMTGALVIAGKGILAALGISAD